MTELVSINQVRQRFIGSEDTEFEISCNRIWGEVLVTISIWRGIEGDGQVKALGQMQFEDGMGDVGGMFTRNFTVPHDFDQEINSLCREWHISPDEQIWEAAQEGA